MLPFPWRIDGYSETKHQLNNTKSITESLSTED